MGRLLLVELRRMLARGVTKLLTLAGAVAIVAVGVLTFIVVDDPAALRAEAELRFERFVSACTAQPEVTLSRVLPPAEPGGPPVIAPAPRAGVEVPPAGSPEARRRCEAVYTGVLANADGGVFQLADLWREPPQFRPGQGPPAEFADLPPLLGSIVMLPAFVLLMGAVVAGGSMVGAEWQAGSFTTLLTWEPRRSRLLAARMIAVALVGTVIALAMLVLFTAVLWCTARVKGELPDSDWWVTYAGVVARLSGLTGLAAVVGAGVAMIGRRTALAVFALPVYLVVAELIVRLRWEAARPWLGLRNLVLAVGGEEYLPDAGSAWRGLLVLLAWSAVVVTVAFVAFNRRDFASWG